MFSGTIFYRCCGLLVGFALLVSAGCGGGQEMTLGKVTGVVTLNGTPLPNAFVTFSPVADGHPSYGTTDENGVYSLTYRGGYNGAVVGEHTVGISTLDPEAQDGSELVPAMYNTASELKATVEKGSNTLDFPLEGEAPQPAKSSVRPAQDV